MADESFSSQGGSQQSFPESQKTYVSSSHHSSSQSLPLPSSSQPALDSTSSVSFSAPPLLQSPSLSRRLRSLPSGFHRLPVELHRRILKLALSPPSLEMPMQSLNAPEAKALLQTCQLFNTLATPLVHSRVLLPSSLKAKQYLSTLQTKPILATYIRRLELQGDQWDAETVVDVLRAVDVLGRLADGSLGLRWLAMSLMGLEIDGVTARELEDVLVGMQGSSSFEWYCPGADLLAVSPPRIITSWSASLRCVGLLLPPPPSLALLQALTSLPHLTHLYLNAGSPTELVTSLTAPALDDSLTVPVLTFYLHLLEHAKARRIRILLYLRKIDEISEPLVRLFGNDPILREILTVTSSVDNHLFGHVFEDMDSSEWRDRVSCERWREILSVPLQQQVLPSVTPY